MIKKNGKSMLRTAMLVAGVLLTGCAMSKETHLPDGRLGHSISCDGSAVGMNVCFESRRTV